MSKEIAKKLIAELQTNEELKAKVAGVTDPAELLKIATDSGYDVTMEEIIEAEKAYRRDKAAETDEKLSFDDLENVAGGSWWRNENAPDGNEIGCNMCYWDEARSRARGYWCKSEYYIEGTKCYEDWN
jgi:predicted ribosomally synthesized peptide with nif11-like leader